MRVLLQKSGVSCITNNSPNLVATPHIRRKQRLRLHHAYLGDIPALLLFAMFG
jgi:hypothetical protein